MSKARRTLRIPDAVTREMRKHQADEPLWYVGALQTENGKDVEVEPRDEEAVPVGGREEPLVVRPGGGSPDAALKE